jgi:hypothetical protein
MPATTFRVVPIISAITEYESRLVFSNSLIAMLRKRFCSGSDPMIPSLSDGLKSTAS